MSRRAWWVAALAGLVLLGSVTPYLLRRVSFFRVRQIEFVGLRYQSADSLLGAMALSPTQSVFDDLEEIAERAERHPGVVSARVERRLPATLRIRIVERAPVALAPGGDGLIALDESGHPLPYDPATGALDAPILGRVDTVLARALAVVRHGDSTLFHEVDGTRRGPGGAIRLELGRGRILLNGSPTMGEVRAVAAVRRHLAMTGRPYRELDARYAGWIVVRRSVT